MDTTQRELEIEDLAKLMASNKPNQEKHPDFVMSDWINTATEIWENRHAITVKARVSNNVIGGQGAESFWIELKGQDRIDYQSSKECILTGTVENELEVIGYGTTAKFSFDGVKVPELTEIVRGSIID